MTVRVAFLAIVCLTFQPHFGNSQSLPDRIQQMVNGRVAIDSIYNFLIHENRHRGGAYNVIRRDIDGKHHQLIAEYHDYKTDYNLLVQSDTNDIYLVVVNTVKTGKVSRLPKNKFFYTDPVRLNQFIILHDSIYHSSLTPEDFKQFVMNRYGRACGYGGVPTPKFSLMMQLVNQKNVAALRLWLKNPDYETKIIAATGLQALKVQNTMLSIDDLFVIEHLKHLNIPVNYCGGCTDWLPSPSSVLLDQRR